MKVYPLMPYKMLIVDDEPANVRLLERLFRREYQVLTANSGAEALALLSQHEVALLITDQRMPGMTGTELLKHAAALRPHMVRIILTGYTDVGALVEAINCGQVYKYVTKPWDNEDLRLTASRALEHYEANKGHYELTLVNQRLNVRLQEMTRGFVRVVADALEAKDEYIHGHARRVSGYAMSIGRRLHMDEDLLESLSLAAFLHDIGKIGTPDDILLKPGPLTEQERATMQLHTERGARMLAGIPEMSDVAAAVRHHHEHYDGTGYPERLSGEMIPLASRIIAVADAYDSMTSPRPFREPSGHDAAIRTLKHHAGTQFDPEVVEVFCRLEALAEIRCNIAPERWGARMADTVYALDEDELSFAEMAGQIESDPVLAACVLSESNKRFPDEPSARIRTACTRLGASGLRSVIVRIGTHDHGDESSPVREHALRAAAAARLLAQHTGIIDVDDAYTLGLLHDIGEMMLGVLFPAEVEAISDCEEDARIEYEVAAFGVDHAQVGQWVLESCGIPRPLTAVVQTHHDIMRINAPAALLLHVANAIAHADDHYKFTALDALGSDRLAMLGLNRMDIAGIHATIAHADAALPELV